MDERLSARLVAVVDESMQPQTLHLWLKPQPEARRASPLADQ